MSLSKYKLWSLKDKLNEQAIAEAKKLAEDKKEIKKEVKVAKKPNK